MRALGNACSSPDHDHKAGMRTFARKVKEIVAIACQQYELTGHCVLKNDHVGDIRRHDVSHENHSVSGLRQHAPHIGGNVVIQ